MDELRAYAVEGCRARKIEASDSELDQSARWLARVASVVMPAQAGGETGAPAGALAFDAVLRECAGA
jgi:hypothetical protein